jgi:ABC-type glycerol-3-phosphate transport system substrate-binding protein
MKGFHFQKYGDKLLFIFALLVLLTVLLRVVVRGNTAAPMVHTLAFAQWREDEQFTKTLQDLINEFEGLNEGIKINLSQKSYEDAWRDLFDSADARTADIFALDPLWVPELIKKEIIDDSEVTTGVLTDVFSIYVLYYNTEILTNAGFSRPPKNRSEFLAQTRAVSRKEKENPSGAFPLGLALGENSSRGIYDDIFPWIWAGGAKLINEMKPVVTSRQVIEALSFLAALKNDGLVAPDLFSKDFEEKLLGFVSGNFAFMIAPSASIEYVRKQMGEEAFGGTSVPVPDNYVGKSLNGNAGWTAGINSLSASKEEARLFLDFLAENASRLFEHSAGQQNSVVPEGKTSFFDPFYSKVSDIAIAGESAADLAGLPWVELGKVFREELSLLFSKASSPQETAAEIQKKWEECISIFLAE